MIILVFMHLFKESMYQTNWLTECGRNFVRDMFEYIFLNWNLKKNNQKTKIFDGLVQDGSNSIANV